MSLCVCVYSVYDQKVLISYVYILKYTTYIYTHPYDISGYKLNIFLYKTYFILHEYEYSYNFNSLSGK